jgi:hypothetical protein
MNRNDYLPRATIAEASRIYRARVDHDAAEARLNAHAQARRERRSSLVDVAIILWGIISLALAVASAAWLLWVVLP